MKRFLRWWVKSREVKQKVFNQTCRTPMIRLGTWLDSTPESSNQTRCGTPILWPQLASKLELNFDCPIDFYFASQLKCISFHSRGAPNLLKPQNDNWRIFIFPLPISTSNYFCPRTPVWIYLSVFQILTYHLGEVTKHCWKDFLLLKSQILSIRNPSAATAILALSWFSSAPFIQAYITTYLRIIER